MAIAAKKIQEEELYSIGEMAKAFDVTPRALRFYEDKGLLNPHRSGVVRMYSPRDRARLKLILRGKRVGLTLMEIRELLDLYNAPNGKMTQMQRTLEKFRAQAETLAVQREEIDEALQELNEQIEWLESKVDSSGGAGKAPKLAKVKKSRN